MGKVKKRLSKRSKAVLKVLEESKDLDISKKQASVRIDATFTPPDKSVRSNLAHKPRPNKKRGG